MSHQIRSNNSVAYLDILCFNLNHIFMWFFHFFFFLSFFIAWCLMMLFCFFIHPFHFKTNWILYFSSSFYNGLPRDVEFLYILLSSFRFIVYTIFICHFVFFFHPFAGIASSFFFSFVWLPFIVFEKWNVKSG